MKASRRTAGGFTLTELVVVIVIVTILSAFAISRINTQSFDTEGFANRAAAMVRYAQKVAVSQRRTVFVVTTVGPPSNIKLCYTDSTCASAVHEPPGTNAFSYNAPTGVSLSAVIISFNALGKPSAGTIITITGDVAREITVEAETGYVH
ncbi:MAG: prepilin-type N-terminal cleavage/methylation domain-containing protein [Betaproteobacteria bacterium]